MQQVTIEVEQQQDLELLLSLVKKMGFKVVTPQKQISRKRLEYLAIVEKGSEVNAISDPIQWQREQRQDRDLGR